MPAWEGPLAQLQALSLSPRISNRDLTHHCGINLSKPLFPCYSCAQELWCLPFIVSIYSQFSARNQWPPPHALPANLSLLCSTQPGLDFSYRYAVGSALLATLMLLWVGSAGEHFRLSPPLADLQPPLTAELKSSFLQEASLTSAHLSCSSSNSLEHQ